MKKYIVYLHSCGFSQSELFDIFFRDSNNPQDFFENLSDVQIQKYISQSKRREKILELYSSINTQKIDDILSSLSVKVICFGESEYPNELKNISHVPYILYVRGCIPRGDMFGVVGSRHITSYGKKCIERIIPELTKVFTIISGGALGCDTQAHKITLTHSGKTVVVIGTGIDKTYPANNAKLFEDIIVSGGALVSIFRLGEPGNPYNFPMRNEIVVGLSRGILVVEAKEKSGSLITAGLCLDYGKDLFSIPGDISLQSSKGTNTLIQKGEAKCVLESADILEEYDILVKKQHHEKNISHLDELESDIFSLISEENLYIDDIVEKLGRSPSEIMMKLSLLELKGIVKKDMLGKYVLI